MRSFVPSPPTLTPVIEVAVALLSSSSSSILNPFCLANLPFLTISAVLASCNWPLRLTICNFLASYSVLYFVYFSVKSGFFVLLNTSLIFLSILSTFVSSVSRSDMFFISSMVVTGCL